MRRMPTGEQIDKIDQAYSLSTTNKKDISTLDGQVAELEQKALTKNRVFGINLGEVARGDKLLTMTFTDPYGGLYLCAPTGNTPDNTGANIYLPGTTSEPITLLADSNVKTLFGNQSIVGTGNIDLYRHNVQIRQGTTGSERYIYTSLYSSKNTPIDSIADLKTTLNLSAGETYPAHGLYNDGMDHQVMYITPVGANLAVAYMTGSLTTTTLSSGVVTDTIKTI